MNREVGRWKNRNEEKEDVDIIYVIGVDGLMHRAYKWERKCLCGCPIRTKRLPKDIRNLRSCYPCTY